MKGLSLHISICRLLSWCNFFEDKTGAFLKGKVPLFFAHNLIGEMNILDYQMV